MELNFVEIAPDLRLNSKNVILETITALKDHPNRWAEVPLKVNNASTAVYWRQKHPEFSFRLTGGNNLKNNDPNKKFFTLYIRYNKPEED